MFYHFESLDAKVIILLIVMAKQTAFFAQENRHVPCSGSRARLYDLCKLQNHPYIQYVYSRAAQS